jgi:hypothetical protein
MSTDRPAISGDALTGPFAPAFEYLVDTGQRSVLFLDVMRQRGVQYREHIRGSWQRALPQASPTSTS